jgi:predicted phage replisome organizer
MLSVIKKKTINLIGNKGGGYMASDVKWIKIVTDIFDDEKIKLIDAMPEADAILVIWFRLLIQAGKSNQNGALFLNNKLAYTDEMLATVFSRKISTVRLALETFETLGMIERGNYIQISNWYKHQNIDGMDKIKLQNTERQRKYREKQKLISSNVKENNDNNVTHNVTVTENNAPRIRIKKEDLEEDKEIKEEVKEKNTKKKVANASVMTSQTLSELDKTLIEFETMRKSMKKTLTEHAKKLLLAKLEKLSKGDEALMVEILNQSILNGWQGIFPFQQDNNTKGSNKSLKVSDWDSLM